MKTKIILPIMLLLFSVSIFSLPPKGCPNCWGKLGKSLNFHNLTVKEISRSGQLLIDMKQIRTALQKSGIDEKISVVLLLNGKRIAVLGLWRPEGFDNKPTYTHMKSSQPFKLNPSLKSQLKTGNLKVQLVIKSNIGKDKISKEIVLKM